MGLTEKEIGEVSRVEFHSGLMVWGLAALSCTMSRASRYDKLGDLSIEAGRGVLGLVVGLDLVGCRTSHPSSRWFDSPQVHHKCGCGEICSRSGLGNQWSALLKG